jgi:hypothetical protein
MALSRAEARILRDLSTKVPTTEARRILHRGRRIAALLNGGTPNERALAFICDALAQEGGLVQELVEDLASRTYSHPTSGEETGDQEPPPEGARRSPAREDSPAPTKADPPLS